MVLEKWFGEWPRAMSGDRMLNTTEKVVAASGTGFAVLVRIFTSQHDINTKVVIEYHCNIAILSNLLPDPSLAPGFIVQFIALAIAAY